MDTDETKLICGIPHIKAQCSLCREWCWTQRISKFAMPFYKCRTCTEPRELNIGKGLLNDDEWD